MNLDKLDGYIDKRKFLKLGNNGYASSRIYNIAFWGGIKKYLFSRWLFTFRTCDRYASVKRACCSRVGDQVVTNELKIVENSCKQRVKRATIVEASYWKYFRDISITIKKKKEMLLRVAKMIDLLFRRGEGKKKSKEIRSFRVINRVS